MVEASRPGGKWATWLRALAAFALVATSIMILIVVGSGPFFGWLRQTVEPTQRPAFGVVALGLGAFSFVAFLLLIRSRPWLSAPCAVLGILGIGIASGFLSPIVSVVPSLLLTLIVPYQQMQSVQKTRLAATTSGGESASS